MPDTAFPRRSALAFALASIAFMLAACAAPLYPVDSRLPAPRSEAEWTRLVEKVRSFQERIGFVPTRNFRRADETLEGYVLCGHTPRAYLPYSYQDPAIRWLDVRTEDECRASAQDNDVGFNVTEAMSGRATPVTRGMLTAPFARFLYLVLHEDCHDQFQFPPGIEEALCNALAYAAMQELARADFGDSPIEYRAISSFAQAGAARAEFMLGLYNDLAALYAQHESKLISEEALLDARTELFRRAAPRLGSSPARLNNVWLATLVTYSRHYRLMERVIDAFEGDLRRTVTFFRRIDAEKAATSAATRSADLGVLRAHEASIVAAIETALATGTLLD